MLEEETSSPARFFSRSRAILALLLGGGLFAVGVVVAPEILNGGPGEFSGEAGEFTVPGEIERHPNARYIRRPAGIEVRRSETTIAPLPDALQRHLMSIESAAEIVAIGLFDGPAELLFGQVSGVSLQDDRIYILDAQAEEVRAFASNGEYLSTFGAGGHGTEFSMPTSLALEPGGDRIWVGGASGRLTRYSYEGDAPSFMDNVNIGVDVEDMCFSKHGLVIHSSQIGGSSQLGDGMLLHSLGAGGEIEGSFARAYGSRSPTLNYGLSPGLVACSPSGAFVFYAFKKLGELRAFRVDGGVRHHGELAAAVQLVGDEVHAPALVRRARGGSDIRLWLVPLAAALDADRQLFLVDALRREARRRAVRITVPL